MSSYLPLSFPLPFSGRHHLVDLIFTPFPVTKHLPRRSLFEPLICFSISPSNYEREESRWLREEQRWLREESRWNAEREFLIREISSLTLRIQELENRDATASESIANIASLLQKKEGNTNLITDRGISDAPIVKEVATLSQKDESKEKEDVKKRETLRKGSEGVDVQLMQEALQRLGFYSGEEDMEYSSFSSGTERAVKTWQASVGIREDGIMTSELQERLHSGVTTEMNLTTGKNSNSVNKDHENGAAMVKKEAEASQDHHPVYLQCLQCMGKGILLCTECNGTGEPNLEPQFMEWLEEGAKCAYCQGSGFMFCDLCEGKTDV